MKLSRCCMTGIISSTVPILSACVGYAPTDQSIGQHRTQVMQALGTPSTELPTPDGSALIYPRGPFGKHTYFIYLNPEGRVIRWTQVLNEKNFSQIHSGMHRNEVIALIGEARDTFSLARGRGYVWNYRYITPHCFWFQIEFSSEDTVRSTGYGRPHECRGRGR